MFSAGIGCPCADKGSSEVFAPCGALVPEQGMGWARLCQQRGEKQKCENSLDISKTAQE